jgi:hypothetical protein
MNSGEPAPIKPAVTVEVRAGQQPGPRSRCPAFQHRHVEHAATDPGHCPGSIGHFRLPQRAYALLRRAPVCRRARADGRKSDPALGARPHRKARSSRSLPTPTSRCTPNRLIMPRRHPRRPVVRERPSCRPVDFDESSPISAIATSAHRQQSGREGKESRRLGNYCKLLRGTERHVVDLNTGGPAPVM